MAEAIRLWEVRGGSLSEVRREPLDLEGRLETWIASDVDVLSDDLLVIGRQLETDAGGYVDLLCINVRGDLVVVELKRDKTPREVTAQALDYGAWARRLSNEQVQAIAEAYLRSPLDEAFRRRFGEELPEVLNAAHHLLIVATAVDARSERIIGYLSEEYGVSINAVTFNYYRSADGREFLARTHLLEPQQVEQRTSERGGSKRQRGLSLDELRRQAEERGAGATFDLLLEGLRAWFRAYGTRSTVTFAANLDGRGVAVFNLVPGESAPEQGLRYRIYIHRFAKALGVTEETIRPLLPPGAEAWEFVSDAPEEWRGYTGYFRTERDAAAFVASLQALVEEDATLER